MSLETKPDRPTGEPPAEPLRGQRVVITRAAHQAEPLAEAYRAAGARPELLPLLEVRPPRDGALEEALKEALGGLPRYRWIAFTSSNAVDAVFERIDRLPSETRVAAVGSSTAAAFLEASGGREVDVLAQEPRAEGLLEALLPHLGSGNAVLLPQAEDARAALADGLRAAGAEVKAVTAYRKALPADARERAGRLFGEGEPLGWVTFTSPSTARRFAALFEEAWRSRRESLRAVSIGPVTSAALEELGVSPAAEAAEPSPHGLVEATVTAASPGPGGEPARD